MQADACSSDQPSPTAAAKTSTCCPTEYLVSGASMILIENSKGDRLAEKFVVVP
ncbi:MAG: hypothetical protein ACI9CO_002175 [Candidatus Azotimanducaceae bacterium]|jgi:hypothetical protein